VSQKRTYYSIGGLQAKKSLYLPSVNHDRKYSMKQSSRQINVRYLSTKMIPFCMYLLRSTHSLLMVMLRHHRHFRTCPICLNASSYSRISSHHPKFLSGPNVNQIQQHDSALIALLTPH
jgi:hypothetical protein